MSIIHATHVTPGFITTASAMPTINRTRSGDANALLLLAMDEANGATTIVDSSTNAWTWTTSGSAAISNAQAKFGTTSLDLTTNSPVSYVSMAYDSNHDIKNDIFTLEFWVYLTAMPAAGKTAEPITWNAGGTGSNDGYAQIRTPINPNGSMYLLSVGATNVTWKNLNLTATGLITTGQWYHIAVVRESVSNTLTYRLYINGVERLSYSSTLDTFNFSGPTYLGVHRAQGVIIDNFTGYIDCVSMLKGFVKYPSGTTFTPPSAVLTNRQTVSNVTISNNVYGVRKLY